MPNIREPKITVNGVELTEAQAMTFRVALQLFLMEVELLTPITLREGYLVAGHEINRIIEEGEA